MRCSLIASPFARHFVLCIQFAIAVIIKYDFASWTPTDVVLFEHHYNVTLSKVEGQNAKLVSDFNAMKGFMLKYEAAEVQTLPPHIVSINPDNRDHKLMHAAEMTSKGAKIVIIGASKDMSGPGRAWCVQDAAAGEWTVKTAAGS